MTHPSLVQRYMQRRSMPHRSKHRHRSTLRNTLNINSSRARPILLVDEEDLDIVMEENGNGRLRELCNGFWLPFFAVV
jgi:hypothetical protein